jgi:hypothetical protein
MIREVSETLSLSNEPDKLANMALDTVAQVLGVDCCWIQTISDRKHKKLNLAAERGFSPEMRQEIGTMDLSHSFSEQIIGLGHKIIIPDLNNDGLYGIPSFKNTGYRWLVAVPLMTYRAHGILGTASRNRKLLKKETAELIMTIAGMIATSLSKASAFHRPPAPEKPALEPVRQIKEALSIQIDTAGDQAKEVNKDPKTPEKKAAAELTQHIKEEPEKAVKKPAPELTEQPKESKKLDRKPVINPIGQQQEIVTVKRLKEELKTIENKHQTPLKTKVPEAITPHKAKDEVNAPAKDEVNAPAKPAKHADSAFHSHARKMEQFRKSHH